MATPSMKTEEAVARLDAIELHDASPASRERALTEARQVLLLAAQPRLNDAYQRMQGRLDLL